METEALEFLDTETVNAIPEAETKAIEAEVSVCEE